MFIFSRPQAKQQRLAEDHAAVNETLETARGFISETERTVADLDIIVQVRSAHRPMDCFMSSGENGKICLGFFMVH